jgi:YjbE family integral membrane protein
MLAGGVLLAWIAYRLLTQSESKDHSLAPAMGFWTAMRTIVIADAVMGMDNVLAVAGAAHGSVALVVLGLLISVPIMVWGSTLILRWIERFPALLYAGGGVLAWTAASMVAHEPRVAELLTGLTRVILYAIVIGGILALAALRNRRPSKEALQ